MITNFLGGEDVTFSGYLPRSLVTLCHQNLTLLATFLPPPSGDVIFEQPLRVLELSGAVSMFSHVCGHIDVFVMIFILWSIKTSDVRRGRGIILSDKPGQTGEGV